MLAIANALSAEACGAVLCCLCLLQVYGAPDWLHELLLLSSHRRSPGAPGAVITKSLCRLANASEAATCNNAMDKRHAAHQYMQVMVQAW